MVLEFCSKGSVTSQFGHLNSQIKRLIALDCAKGMEVSVFFSKQNKSFKNSFYMQTK